MTPAAIDRVFGRGRLRMVTGDHVEVFREESQPGERRRYTKRFLATPAGDFREWTEREWRILARLVGHGIGPVPDVVQFDRGASGTGCASTRRHSPGDTCLCTPSLQRASSSPERRPRTATLAPVVAPLPTMRAGSSSEPPSGGASFSARKVSSRVSRSKRSSPRLESR